MKHTRTAVSATGVDRGDLHGDKNSPAILVRSSDHKTISIPARYAMKVAIYTLFEETTESQLWLNIPGARIVKGEEHGPETV